MEATVLLKKYIMCDTLMLVGAKALVIFGGLGLAHGGEKSCSVMFWKWREQTHAR